MSNLDSDRGQTAETFNIQNDVAEAPVRPAVPELSALEKFRIQQEAMVMASSPSHSRRPFCPGRKF